MADEIERKYLVTGDAWREGARGVRYTQGYISRDADRIVRIRRAGEKAFITIKGGVQGITRKEYEYSIPMADAEEMLKLCVGGVIDKTRTVVEYHGKHWEVDEFHGDNAGLIVAELELNREDEAFDLPPWIGADVSDDPRYFNSNLSEHPYKDWRDAGA